MKISVTAEDIAEGVVGACNGCPLALAISRAVQPTGKREVLVGATLVELYDNARSRNIWSAILPEVASDFIRAFDRGDPVKPFYFDLEVPDA